MSDGLFAVFAGNRLYDPIGKGQVVAVKENDVDADEDGIGHDGGRRRRAQYTPQAQELALRVLYTEWVWRIDVYFTLTTCNGEIYIYTQVRHFVSAYVARYVTHFNTESKKQT